MKFKILLFITVLTGYGFAQTLRQDQVRNLSDSLNLKAYKSDTTTYNASKNYIDTAKTNLRTEINSRLKYTDSTYLHINKFNALNDSITNLRSSITNVTPDSSLYITKTNLDSVKANRAYTTHGHSNYLANADTSFLFYVKHYQQDTAISNRAYASHVHSIYLKYTDTTYLHINKFNAITDSITQLRSAISSGSADSSKFATRWYVDTMRTNIYNRFSSHTHGIGSLSDVDTAGISVDNVLGWNGTKWVKKVLSAGGSVGNADSLGSVPALSYLKKADSSYYVTPYKLDTAIIKSPSTVPSGSLPYFNSTTGKSLGASGVYWDVVNSRLGIGTSSPIAKLHIVAGNGFTEPALKIVGTAANSYQAINFYGGPNIDASKRFQFGQYDNGNAFFYNSANAALNFYTNNALKMGIEGSGKLSLYDNAATPVARFIADPNVSDGATAVAYISDTKNTLSTSGARLWSIRNGGTEKFSGSFDGYFDAYLGYKINGAFLSSNDTTLSITDTSRVPSIKAAKTYADNKAKVNADSIASHNTRINAAIQLAADSIAAHNTRINAKVNTANNSMGALNNVDTTGIADGKILKWDNAASKWKIANDSVGSGGSSVVDSTEYLSVDESFSGTGGGTYYSVAGININFVAYGVYEVTGFITCQLYNTSDFISYQATGSPAVNKAISTYTDGSTTGVYNGIYAKSGSGTSTSVRSMFSGVLIAGSSAGTISLKLYKDSGAGQTSTVYKGTYLRLRKIN